MAHGFKNVYMSPESEIIDKELITLKEKIMYFERIKNAGGLADNIQSPKVIRTNEIKVRNGANECKKEDRSKSCMDINNNDANSCEKLENEGRSKSRIELLREQLFERNNEEFRDEKRMAEVDRICRLGTIEKIKETNYDGEKKGNESESNVFKLEKNELYKGDSEAKQKMEVCFKNENYDVNNSVINQTNNNNTYYKSDEDIINDIISGDVDSVSFFNLEEFDTKLNAMIDEETHKNSESITECVDKNFNEKNVLKQDDFEITKRCPKRICESTISEDKLPNTFEILNDFSKCNLRPRMFSCPELNSIDSITSMNLYINCINSEFSSVTTSGTVVATPLFSRTHYKQIPVVFRAPGQVLSGRPNISFLWSVVAEHDVLVYFRIFEKKSEWHILKPAAKLEKYKSEAELIARLDAMDDTVYAKFVLSDIVTTLYHRTSYVYYENNVVLLKILGSSLCICLKDRCIKMIPLFKQKSCLFKINTRMGPGFTVANVVFGCSCVRERDEWYDMLTTLCV